METEAEGHKMVRIVGAPPGRNGFSLLEILVALVLLSVAATALFQLFSRSSRNIAVSEDYLAGAIVGETSMRKVLDNDDLREGTLSETKENGYKVEARIAEVLKEKTENLQFRVFDVDMSVRWLRGTKEKVIRLKTLKLVSKTGLKGGGTGVAPEYR